MDQFSPKQNSEKTSSWLTLTQPERRLLLLDPAYMIRLLASPTIAQLNFFYLSSSFCAMPEIRPSFSKAILLNEAAGMSKSVEMLLNV